MAILINPGGRSEPRSLASGLLRAGSVAAFRALAPLPKNTQELIDAAVVRVGRQRLTVAEDVLAEGLIYNLPNWLSVPTLYWERLAEAGQAQRTMVPKARGERQVMQRDGKTIPIYCTWDDFSFDIRELLAAERVGSPLDTTHIEQATRNVNEGIEDAILNGGPTVGGNTSPGILNAPNAETGVITEAKWAVQATVEGATVVAETLAMVKQLHGNKKYGPYNLYVGTDIGLCLENDYSSTKGEGTIRQRVEQIQGGGRGIRVRVADMMPANTVALVQMTSDVVQMVVGQTPTTVSWEDGPGWERNFVVLACLVPRVRDDAAGNSGIVVGV